MRPSGLGGFSIALFGHVGCSIYVKAADVGADLSSKNDYSLEEDDYRIPACIAENVGDNVGNIAGMKVDLFSYHCQVHLCRVGARGVVAGFGWLLEGANYPALFSSAGVCIGIRP